METNEKIRIFLPYYLFNYYYFSIGERTKNKICSGSNCLGLSDITVRLVPSGFFFLYEDKDQPIVHEAARVLRPEVDGALKIPVVHYFSEVTSHFLNLDFSLLLIYLFLFFECFFFSGQ